MIIVKEVTNKNDLKKFIKFPNSLYRNNNSYTKELYNEELNNFSSLKNDAYSYCEVHHFLAYKDGKVVGRVASIINHRYNLEKKVKQIRFSRFDVIDDVEVSRLLLEKVKEEAIKNDLDEIVGPLGFTNLDKKGILIDGFEINDNFYYHYNASYYQKHLKTIGFVKDFDWNMYRIKVPKAQNNRQNEMSKYILGKYNLELKQVRKTNDINKYVNEAVSLRYLVNGHKYGYNELTDKQIKAQIEANKYFLSLQYSLMIVDKNEDVVAYCFATPLIHKKFLKSKGKFNFYNRFRLYLELKNNQILHLSSIIVNQKYQNIGLEQILFNEMINIAINKNVKYIDTASEIEYSKKLLDDIDFVDKEVIKKRRSYKLKIK